MEARAEIDRLITFLDATEVYVTGSALTVPVAVIGAPPSVSASR